MTNIVKIIYIDKYNLEIYFCNGSYGIIDLSYLIGKNTSLTNPLKDIKYFKDNFIDFGALCWKNGLELSAESLYERLKKSKNIMKNSNVA